MSSSSAPSRYQFDLTLLCFHQLLGLHPNVAPLAQLLSAEPRQEPGALRDHDVSLLNSIGKREAVWPMLIDVEPATPDDLARAGISTEVPMYTVVSGLSSWLLLNRMPLSGMTDVRIPARVIRSRGTNAAARGKRFLDNWLLTSWSVACFTPTAADTVVRLDAADRKLAKDLRQPQPFAEQLGIAREIVHRARKDARDQKRIAPSAEAVANEAPPTCHQFKGCPACAPMDIPF